VKELMRCIKRYEREEMSVPHHTSFEPLPDPRLIGESSTARSASDEADSTSGYLPCHYLGRHCYCMTSK
jgi:hypothetical protein